MNCNCNCNCGSSSTSNSVLQTYIGPNGNLWIGNTDTGVYLLTNYFGGVLIANNYQNNNPVQIGQVKNIGTDITLNSLPTGDTINLAGGKTYAVWVNGGSYSQALSNPTWQLVQDGTNILAESTAGTNTSGSTNTTISMCATVTSAPSGSTLQILAKNNNIAISFANIIIKEIT